MTKAEKHRIHNRNWYAKNKERLRKYALARYYADPESAQHAYAVRRENTRLSLIDAYGGQCQCCGEKKREFLTIDHINGGGCKERRELNLTSGSQFYRFLEKNGFPKENYRLLCYNCNLSRGHLGYCPHEWEKL